MRRVTYWAVLFLFVGLVGSGTGCDLATEAPDFTVTPRFEGPLVSEQAFVLFGPDSTDRVPLIDTTKAGADSLFSVTSADQSVLLTKQVALLKGQSLARLFPPFQAGPASLAVSARKFLPRQVGTSFGESVGVWTRPAVETPLLPVQLKENALFAVAPDAPPVTPDDPLFPAELDKLVAVRLSRETEAVNQYQFVLQNRLNRPLVDPGEEGERAPVLVIESAEGDVIAQERFPVVPEPNTRVTARISVAGRRLPRPLRFRLRATTPDGFSPLEERPEAVQLSTTAAPFRIVETTVQDIPAQSTVELPSASATVDAGTGVRGIVVQNATATLDFKNTLPYPITITELSARNDATVGDFPSGTNAFAVESIRVPANGSRTIQVELGRTAVASQISPEVTVEGEAVRGPVSVRASDGLEVTGRLAFDLETLYMQPTGQQIRGQGDVPLRSQAIRLEAPSDFVALGSGMLEFESIRNELPSDVDPLRVAFPSFLTPPYRSKDSLVVQFGTSEAGGGVRPFPPLPAQDVLRNQTLDLSGMRFELPGGRVPVRGHVRLPANNEVKAFGADDQVSTSIRVQDLTLQGLQADVEPLTALIPADGDGTQTLDIEIDQEARILDAAQFHQIGGTEITALDLSETQIRLSVTTNVEAEATLYLAVLGRRSDGRETYLSGRGPYAVSEDDTTAQRLHRGGEPIPHTNLLRIPISGASSPAESVTQVIELNSETASLPAFLRLLPEEMRVIGRLVVQPDGGRVRLQKPVDFQLGFGLAQPFRVGGDVAFTQTVDADLSALETVPDGESDAGVQQLGLRVPYENGFPLTATLRLDVLDEQGDVLAQIPAADSTALRLAPAPVAETGGATGVQSGRLALRQSPAQIERLSQGKTLRLNVRFRSSGAQDAVLRSTDGFSLRLEGGADLRLDSAN